MQHLSLVKIFLEDKKSVCLSSFIKFLFHCPSVATEGKLLSTMLSPISQLCFNPFLPLEGNSVRLYTKVSTDIRPSMC